MLSRCFSHAFSGTPVKMRRALQEITNEQNLRAILQAANYASLGLTDGKSPYVVPMSFGYEWGKPPIFYFHGAAQGRKIDLIRANPRACVTFVSGNKFVPADSPCNASCTYNSIIAEGDLEFLTDPQAKKKALEFIVKQYTEMKGHFNADSLKRVTVFRLIPTNLRGKSHEKPA
jgi:nitroimidazol reductase NimA-like FMN-containing flavoprotein (pyridoxamine 5'-phosphate oxidase superfamily)